MFDLETAWDRPVRSGPQPTEHILRVRLTPRTMLGESGGIPLRLAIALDSSGSMAGAKREAALDACRAVLRLLRPEDRLSLAAFGDELRVLLQAMTGGTAALEAGETAFGSLQPLGVTRTDLALDWLTRALPPEPGTLGVALLLTDGHPTDAQGRPLSSVVPLLAQATNLADQGVTLCTVGLGNAADFNTGFLVDLSDRGRGAFLYAALPEALEPLLRDRLGRAQSVASAEASLHLRPLLAGLEIESACRLRPEFVPLTPAGTVESRLLTLPALPGDVPTDVLLAVRIPPQGFGEPLGLRDVLEVRLEAEGMESRTMVAHTSTASYRETQQLDAEVDQDRMQWELNRYSTALTRTTDSRRTFALLSDFAAVARRSGRTELAERAESETAGIAAGGTLAPHTSANLLTSTRDLEGR